MSKYKVGDKFILEIEKCLEKNDKCNEPIYYIKGDRLFYQTETELNQRQPYHEPTLMEHALALQDNCEKYFDEDTCVGCEFAEENACRVDLAINWELDIKPKLTEKEREILEFWDNKGAMYVRQGLGDNIIIEDSDNRLIAIINRRYAPNIYILAENVYLLDDLLEGE